MDVECIQKIARNQKQFWKMYQTDFLRMLGIAESKQQIQVLIHIIEHTEPGNNIFLGSYGKISSETGVSKQTVYRFMRELKLNNVIKPIQNGAYMVSPNIMLKGDKFKRKSLLVSYQYEQQLTPLEVEQIAKLPPINEDEVSGQMNLQEDFPEYLPEAAAQKN